MAHACAHHNIANLAQERRQCQNAGQQVGSQACYTMCSRCNKGLLQGLCVPAKHKRAQDLPQETAERIPSLLLCSRTCSRAPPEPAANHKTSQSNQIPGPSSIPLVFPSQTSPSKHGGFVGAGSTLAAAEDFIMTTETLAHELGSATICYGSLREEYWASPSAEICKYARYIQVDLHFRQHEQVVPVVRVCCLNRH